MLMKKNCIQNTWIRRHIFFMFLFIGPVLSTNGQLIDSTWMRVRQFINQPMPAVNGTTLAGKKIDSAYFQNHVVLLSFANLINVGSLQQIPYLNRIKSDFAGRPFNILSVIPNATDDIRSFNSTEPVNAEAYRLRQTFKLPVMEYDVMPVCTIPRPAGEPIAVLCDSIVKDYLIGGYPTVCLIDKKGIIRYVHVGFAPKDQREDWLALVEKQLNELLGPPEPGERVVLKNVLFESNSFALRSESTGTLDELSAMLMSHPAMKIRITGYTDSNGDETYNLNLSANRAKAVYDYLVKKGINPSRLMYEGMGEADPIASNDTDAGRAQNRRIEFAIVSQ